MCLDQRLCVLESVGDRENAIRTRQFERTPHLRGVHDENELSRFRTDLPITLAGTLQHPHQKPEARRIEEVDVAEINDQIPAPLDLTRQNLA